MDDDAAAAIDARLNGLSAAICALVAAMAARGDIEKGVVKHPRRVSRRRHGDGMRSSRACRDRLLDCGD